MTGMKFPINSRGANPILTTEYDVITLQEINDIFEKKDISNQMRLCQRLGISITGDSICIIVRESGRAYQMPNEDRTILSDHETSHEFQLNFSVANSGEKFPLPLSINFGKCSNQVFVNFFGEIVFMSDAKLEVSVPLIGRGTAALEGRENDAHAEPCIDGSCASFQQKTAILMSILAYLRITRDDIEILRAHLLKDCEKFYGRNDILNYTCDKAFSLTNLSYYEYLKITYSSEEDEDNVPFMLRHFIEFCEPHPLYFESLREQLTVEELDIELRDTTRDPKGPDQKPISTVVREIINKLIFLDEIYMVKPYPGDEISMFDLAKEFNSESITIIKSALERLGVFINDGNATVKFTENSAPFLCDDNKNTAKQHSEQSFELLMNVSRNEEVLSSIKIFIDINPIDNVNFYGKIEIKNGFFFKTLIPLLGRGTVALDGRLDDKHAGFCTGSKSASFQQKVALIYSCLVVLGAKEGDLRKFENNIRNINNSFYRLQDIIDYTFSVAAGKEKKTFFEYMKMTHMNYSKMPIMLKTILTYNRLPSKYYEGLIPRFTEQELKEEEKRLQSIRLSNIIPKFIRKFSFVFGKINIF